jgi:serralysin
VSLSLAAGTGYSIGTSTAVTGTIANDDPAAAQTAFTAGVDVLTGTTAGEQFTVARLSDALWSSTPDRITNLQAGLDVIDSPFNRTTAIAPRLLGAVKTLDAAGITALLTTKTFAKNGASTFTFGSGAELRTFLAVNDGVAGFNAATDSVIEITGFSGSLSSLAIL